VKRIAIFGSTGSIGVSALEVVAAHPEAFEIGSLVCGENAPLLAEQARRFHPKWVGIADEKGSKTLRDVLDSTAEILVGRSAIEELAAFKEFDLVLMAIGGAAALAPTLAAVRAGKQVAIANKECLVMAGDLLVEEARRSGAFLLPVDSEHNAIFQCLEGKNRNTLRRIYLTGSGGPLRKRSRESFGSLTQEEVLNHPKWKMGKKITVDSATMMNKGLEVIEARHLFGVEAGEVEVLIHPEAVIHSMVEFVDGSILAQLAVTDMKLPIQYALSYPERLPSRFPTLNFKEVGQLTFENPDMEKFPCLRIGYEVARQGGTAPCVLNAANEEAVKSYLGGGLPFVKIPDLIETILAKQKRVECPTLDDILAQDSWAREEAQRTVERM